jgi:3-oxo-5-alpha-steroid 4-dehydrogenase 1
VSPIDPTLHRVALGSWIAVSALVFVLLTRITAPYGRHRRRGWGPEVPDRIAWVAMETPAVVTMALMYLGGPRRDSAGALLLIGLWELHYLHRTFVYPLRKRATGRRMPVAIAALAAGTNVAVGWIVGAGVFHLDAAPATGGPRLWIGLVAFFGGLALNLHSDEILRRLRRRPGDDYAIPRGGGYRWVSSPNYLGELVEWAGFALIAGSPAAWGFVAWSAANLVPRARSHHRWYRERFPEYPPERRALVPFVW